MKRFIDTLVVILFAPLWLPLLAVAALGVRIALGSPVLFRQERIGRGDKPFTILKLRTMLTGEGTDAERLTPFGRLLRKTSLDELPQFFNVIGGSMSLIGPRPERPELVEQFKQTIPGYDLRHRVKAGISGWAQVNGLRGNTSIEKRVAFDLYYIRHWSVFFDFKVVILTFLKGFINKNAY